MYKLKDFVTKEDLESVGFVNNEWGKNDPIEQDEDGIFEAIRTSNGVAVTAEDLTYYGKGRRVEAYLYKGEEHKHEYIKDVDPKPYIADLIEKGWVEEV